MTMRKQALVGAIAFGGSMTLSEAFTAPQTVTKGVSAQALRGLGIQQQATVTNVSATSGSVPCLFAGAAAGLVAAGAAAAKKRKSPKQALPKAMENTGGPFPSDVWDPLGLMNGKSEDEILNLRAAELKHGRVAMLACLGWWHVGSGVHFIGDAALGYRASDNPLTNLEQTPIAGIAQLAIFFVAIEWLLAYVCTPPKGRPWDVLGWNEIIYDEEDFKWKERQLQELNNGRIAMVGIIGLIMQCANTGDYAGWVGEPLFGVQWWGQSYTDFFSWDGGKGQTLLEWPTGPIGFPALYPGQGPFGPPQ